MEIYEPSSKREIHIGDATFTVEVPSAYSLEQLQAKCTAKKGLNMPKYMRRALSRYLVGWQGITKAGASVEFSVENIDLLPMSVRQNIMMELAGYVDDEDEEEG